MNQLSPAMQQMYDNFVHAQSLGILQGHYSDSELNGRTIHLNGRELLHFANCSYLGLELDHRLKDAAKEAINRHGIQFSSSRTYLESPLYGELEEKLSKIYGKPTLISATTSLGHISWIPVAVAKEDAVILDHQVHRSVQNATLMVKATGTHVELVRHNRMDLLEERIIELSKKYTKVWYMADGVYSMFGDVAPVQQLYELMDKYEQFHVYLDDAHGMSWAGENGKGYALSMVENLHPKMCFITSLAKGFGANGAVMVFSDELQKLLIRNMGSTIIFSGPVPPVILAAASASADIHLSSEIYERQDRLQQLMQHFVDTANKLNLPLVRQDLTPICFLATGADGTNLLEITSGLQRDGFFVNPSSYPSVPLKNSGVRITLNLHHTEENITNLLEALQNRLNQRGIITEEVMKAFIGREVVSA